MSWIEPLEMETWFMKVFAGSPDIFLGISLIALTGMAGWFKMNALTMFFMIGIFLLMFSEEFIQSPFVALFSVIAALIVGISINKIANRT